jgi:hypothetical protein
MSGFGCASDLELVALPCPVPSEAAVQEMREGFIGPQVTRYLGRIVVHCEAIKAFNRKD